VIRFLPPTIGLLAALVPGLARAQTNLDQGKSASQIFASACAECHKDARALGKGKNASVLTNFLDEHYTTNTQQAAALAAFIMGGRGGEPIGAAAQGRGQKPAAQRASASTEEPKPPKHQATQSAKPEDGKPADGKPHRPTREAAKPRDNASPSERPSFLGIIAPEPGQHNRPSTASRSRKEPKTPPPGQEPAAATHEPAPVVTEPGPAEAPASSESHASPSTTAAAPANAASGEPGEAPVPRDNVPD
jgi:hypothetical protein